MITNTGLWTITTSSAFGAYNFTQANITNTGTITKSGVNTASFFDITTFLNNGTVNCNGGGFRMVTSGSTFNNNGTLSFNGGQFLGESGVVFNHNPNAIIKGSGTFRMYSLFTNNGIIAPGASPGILAINWIPQPFSANSIVDIEVLDNSGPGTGHDQITRTDGGAMSLAGTLNVTESPG